MGREVTDELLTAARSYVGITWDDPEGDRNLKATLLRGMARLDHIAGMDVNYAEGTQARAILLEYLRYVRAGELSSFERDFAGELLDLHRIGEVEQHEKAGPNV